jgi:hypothetical protein
MHLAADEGDPRIARMSLGRLEWPRFPGAVVRDRIPVGFLEHLGERASTFGLRVREESADGGGKNPPGYRTSASSTRSLVIDVPKDHVSYHDVEWRSLRVWQDGNRVHFAASLPGWWWALLPAFFWTLLLDFSPTSLKDVRGLVVLIAPIFIAMLLIGGSIMRRNQARRNVIDLLSGEIDLLVQATPIDHVTTNAPGAAAWSSTPAEPRLRVADPVPAATIPAARDEVPDPALAALEDETDGLEPRAARR